jgi:hypothetical protein
MTNIHETSTNTIAAFSIPFTIRKPLTIATVVTDFSFKVNGVKKDIDFNELMDVSKVKGE